MADTDNYLEKEIPATVTDEPTDQLAPDEEPENDVNEHTEDEPYEGIRHDEKEEGLVDDNMTEMPVVPSPS